MDEIAHYPTHKTTKARLNPSPTVSDLDEYCRSLPKAELHIHIEGTLEPELMLGLAKRNDVPLPFRTTDEVRAAYEFTDLESFLDLYYQAAQVLRTEQDFYDLMWSYLRRAAANGVRRAEIFFDPQTHTDRGIGLDVLMRGLHRAVDEGGNAFGLSADLILCFLRHLPAQAAVETLESALAYRDWFIGVGLDSSEVGNPPERFEAAYRLARSEGLRPVAHAGEEGPPSYILGALDVLGVERVDHGVRAFEDEDLVNRLARDGIPLTMCPLSNVRLKVFDDLADHNLRVFLERGVKVTINSDDPAYFGGYVAENYAATARALRLTSEQLVTIARNSLEASFVSDAERTVLLAELEDFVS